MEMILMEFIFLALFLATLFIYMLGRKKDSDILKCIGRRGIVLVSLVVVLYNWFVIKSVLNNY